MVYTVSEKSVFTWNRGVDVQIRTVYLYMPGSCNLNGPQSIAHSTIQSQLDEI